MQTRAGHAFISYVREDSGEVDSLQAVLEAAGISVWRDTSELWPGEDWRARIRDAIMHGALVFIVCFSSRSLARRKSYQNEELALAIEELRLRRPDVPWLIPVRFDNCDVPDLEIGGGRRLGSIQWADLFGPGRDLTARRLTGSILRLLGRSVPEMRHQHGRGTERPRRCALDIVFCVNTGIEMTRALPKVKDAMLAVCRQIPAEMGRYSRPVVRHRIRVITFRQNVLSSASFYALPEQAYDCEAAISGLTAGGQGSALAGLRALREAISSDWERLPGASNRQVVTVFAGDATLPEPAPGVLFDEIINSWYSSDTINQQNRLLCIFAPDLSPWREIGDNCADSIRIPTEPGSYLSALDAEDIVSMLSQEI